MQQWMKKKKRRRRFERQLNDFIPEGKKKGGMEPIPPLKGPANGGKGEVHRNLQHRPPTKPRKEKGDLASIFMSVYSKGKKERIF